MKRFSDGISGVIQALRGLKLDLWYSKRLAMSLETARKVLQIEAHALAELVERLDDRFVRAVETLYACKGRVVVTGMGKSGLIGQKIAATFSSTGTPAFFLHP